MPHVPETLPPPKAPAPRAQSPLTPKREHVHPSFVAQPFLAVLLSAPHPLPDATPPPALPSHLPAQSPRPFPAPRAPTPQTPSNWAIHPDRSTQTASKTLLTFYKESAAPSLPCVPRS